MRVAALYDIHGNLPALDAVLRDVDEAGVDEIVIGGDVLPGPMPRESLARLLQLDLPVRFIRGNGDRVVLGQMSGIEPTEVPAAYRGDIRWNAEQLQPVHRAALASWPLTIRLRHPALGDVLFCHATPRSDSDMFTRLTPEALLVPLFAESNADVVVCGHTHMQFDRMIGSVRVVNAGSVGMPFGEPHAYWLRLGEDVQFKRTPYDLAAAADTIRRTAYPRAEEFAVRNVLAPPDEASMLDAFTHATYR